MSPKLPKRNSQSASEMTCGVDENLSKAELSKSYQFAFNDVDFLNRQETRGIRFELELLKPELVLKEHGINHTIVVFGSAKCMSQDCAQLLVQKATTEKEKEYANQAFENSKHYESARQFGELVANYNLQQSLNENRLRICTGGGPGIMEAANRGAFEAGDLSVGFNISLPHEQHPNKYLTPELSFRFHYFALRKMHFMMRARAIVAYPGGYGSFDELFECLTLIQTKKISKMPVILVDRNFWETVVRFDMIVEQGLIDEADYKLIQFVETPEQAWETIYQWYELSSQKNLPD